MPRYTIDIHTLTHTCPIDAQPHVVDTWRTVVAVDYWGLCLAPRTIQCGARVAQVDCGSVAPADRQCGTCFTTIVVRNATTADIGFEGTCPTAIHNRAGGGR